MAKTQPKRNVQHVSIGRRSRGHCDRRCAHGDCSFLRPQPAQGRSRRDAHEVECDLARTSRVPLSRARGEHSSRCIRIRRESGGRGAIRPVLLRLRTQRTPPERARLLCPRACCRRHPAVGPNGLHVSDLHRRRAGRDEAGGDRNATRNNTDANRSEIQAAVRRRDAPAAGACEVSVGEQNEQRCSVPILAAEDTRTVMSSTLNDPAVRCSTAIQPTTTLKGARL